MNYAFFVGFWLYLLATVIFAHRSGGQPERIGVNLMAGAALSSLLVSIVSSAQYQGMNDGLFVIDLGLLGALVLLALRADRFWPIAAAGLQMVAVGTHVSMRVSPQLLPDFYAWIAALWSYPVILTVVIGTWRHRRRLAQSGVDRSWARSSSRSQRKRTN